MMPLKDMMKHVFEYDIYCYSCNKPLETAKLKTYPHNGGWETEHGKEWISFECTDCGYNTSMDKVLVQLEHFKNPRTKRYPIDIIGLDIIDLQTRANSITMNGRPYHLTPSMSYWLLFRKNQLYTKVELQTIVNLCYCTGDAEGEGHDSPHMLTDTTLKEYDRLFELTQQLV